MKTPQSTKRKTETTVSSKYSETPSLKAVADPKRKALRYIGGTLCCSFGGSLGSGFDIEASRRF